MYIFLLLSLWSCKTERTERFAEARKEFNNFLVYGDTLRLEQSYNYLSKDLHSKYESIDLFDFHLIADVYMHNKKHRELKIICDTIQKRKIHEDLKYLIDIKSRLNSYSITSDRKYIKQSYVIIEKRIEEEKDNEILYADLFTVMLHELRDRDMVLFRLDSFQHKTNTLSDDFYKYQLREFISEYPSLMFKN